MKVIITRRVKPLRFGGVLIPILSLIIGVVTSQLILWAVGVPPEVFYSTLASAFLAPEMLRSFILLTILGSALLVAFVAAVWNIGAEGQIVWGMVVAAYIGIFLAAPAMKVPKSELSKYASMPGAQVLDYTNGVVTMLHWNPVFAGLVMILAAAAMGALWAFIAGALKAYFEIDEVASTLIMNYIAYYSLNQLATGPMKGLSVQAAMFGRTDALNDALRFPRLPIPGTTVTSVEVALAVITFVGVWFILRYTSLGLRLKILGSNPNALRAAGINTKKYIVLALTISGLIAGTVGAALFAGDYFFLGKIDNIVSPPTQNMGYTAILVAWLSMLDIRAVPIAAYLIAVLMQSGATLQANLGTLGSISARISGSAITYTLIGFVLLTFSVLRILTEYRIRFVRKGGER
ncbi:MAG: ABC transporter permease [Desulfurococcales archaeon]|nr:ABC transporter permease [Desulfurococcales archaeon]